MGRMKDQTSWVPDDQSPKDKNSHMSTRTHSAVPTHSASVFNRLKQKIRDKDGGVGMWTWRTRITHTSIKEEQDIQCILYMYIKRNPQKKRANVVSMGWPIWRTQLVSLGVILSPEVEKGTG